MRELIGEKIELNKFDPDESERMSVSGTIIKHFYNTNGSAGFYLLKLDKPFKNRSVEKNLVLFWSPLFKLEKNVDESVDAFVMLIPNLAAMLKDQVDEKKLIPFAWVKASRKTHTKNVFPSITSVINKVRHKAQQISIAY